VRKRSRVPERKFSARGTGPQGAVDVVQHQSNATQLLQMRRRISARAACALEGNFAGAPMCGKLWMQNADEVSGSACSSPALLTALYQLASALQRLAALNDADVTSQRLIVV
jgi:hypothetical protein